MSVYNNVYTWILSTFIPITLRSGYTQSIGEIFVAHCCRCEEEMIQICFIYMYKHLA